MTDYTPTTAEVRAEYVANRAVRVSTTTPVADEFHRWLAAHDAEMRAEGFDEGAQWAAEECGVRGPFMSPGDNPYRNQTAGGTE